MTPDQIASQIEKTKRAHVSIYEGRTIRTNDRACFSTVDYSDVDKFELDAGQAAKLFLEFCEDLGPGNYMVRLMTGPKGHNGARDLRMVIEEGNGKWAKSAGIAGIDAGGLADFRDALRKEMQAELNAYKAEQEKQKLLDEIAELKDQVKDARSWESKVGFLAEQGIEMLFDKSRFKGALRGPQQPAQIGNNDQAQSAPAAADQQQAEDATEAITQHMGTIADKIGMDSVLLVEKLAGIDPEKLQKLARLPEDDLNKALKYLT